MTTPPDDGLLFDVAAAPTTVERLLLLADRYVRHNDILDQLIQGATHAEHHGHAAFAQELTSSTAAAIKAITDERLYQSTELAEAITRLRQLAYLSGASADHRLPTARMLTALAPEAVLDCAARVATELHRRRPASTDTPGRRLDPVQRTALFEIARGHVVTATSQGRQYVHHRDARVLISTLRSLTAEQLIESETAFAPSAFLGGPLQDRVRLTRAGATVLAAALAVPPAGRAPSTTAAPAPAATRTTARSR